MRLFADERRKVLADTSHKCVMVAADLVCVRKCDAPNSASSVSRGCTSVGTMTLVSNDVSY